MTTDDRQRIWCLQILIFLLLWTPAIAAAPSYDPLVISGSEPIQTVDMTIHDAARKRDIPIRVYLPPEKSSAPVLLFSHGLGGSREGNAFLGSHWAGRGYVSVFIQHPGSDTEVWRGKPLGQRLAAMQQAADLDNFMLRVKDVPSVLDQLDRWNRLEGHSRQEGWIWGGLECLDIHLVR
jgi:predicted dienelactone hydrolase